MEHGAESYRRFLQGDDEGIAEIVSEYKNGLILFLNGYVKNPLLAEELAEDTFFRLLIKKPKFSGKSSFRSWLYAIGRNAAVDELRRRSKRNEAPLEAAEQAADPDFISLEDAYLRNERAKILHRAMASLAPDYEAVLWLVFFEGFTNRDAARALRKTDRQIKNLLYRAKQSLKEKLVKEGFTSEEL